MTLYTQYQYDLIPDQIIRMVIETIPFRVCQLPRITLLDSGENVPLDILVPLNKAIRNNWCFARLNGRSIMVAKKDGSVEVGLPYSCNIEFETSKINYNLDRVVKIRDYRTEEIVLGFLLHGVDYYSDQQVQNFYGCPVITDGVFNAICLYRKVIERLKERIEDSNNTLVSLEGEQGEIKLKELYEDLEEQFEKKKRIYAPSGSSIQGVNFALADIDTSIKPFIEHIAMEAGIPLWMLEKDVKNSEFILQYQSHELERFFYNHVFESYRYIFNIWGIPVEIKAPTYRSESFALDQKAKEADINYKNAASKRLIKMAEMLGKEEPKVKGAGSVGGRML